MGNRNVALLVVLSAGAIAGIAWHFGGYARPAPQEENTALTRIDASPPTIAIAIAPDPGLAAPKVVNAQPDERLSDTSVVGLPFELSRSVQANCDRFRSDCKELEEFLVRMAAEPRNPGWARDMEARIEKAVMSGERGKFRIRALECRSTRCAVEVSSEVDNLGIEFDSDPEFSELMFARPGYFSNEEDPQTGVLTMVSAQTWQTWESFSSDEEVSE